MKILAIFITVVVLLFGKVLYALGGGGLGYRDGLFWGNDLNRDEYLTISEAKNINKLGNPDVFAKYDKDKNGLLTKFEFYDYMIQRNSKE